MAHNVHLGEVIDGAKFWWCGGTVIVDTVVDRSYTFHFDTVCKPNPVVGGTGSVRLVGKGAGTLPTPP